jgi:hypothetical protein
MCVYMYVCMHTYVYERTQITGTHESLGAFINFLFRNTDLCVYTHYIFVHIRTTKHVCVHVRMYLRMRA